MKEDPSSGSGTDNQERSTPKRLTRTPAGGRTINYQHVEPIGLRAAGITAVAIQGRKARAAFTGSGSDVSAIDNYRVVAQRREG